MANVSKKSISSKPKPLDKKKDDSSAKDKPDTFRKVFSNQRVWSRAVMILAVMVYVWYTSKTKETVLGKQKDLINQRGQAFECDESYLDEVSSYEGCRPAKCGRYISDKLVTASEAEILLRIANQGFAMGGSDGGASILDLHSGALSYGKQFINVYKVESGKKLFSPTDLIVYKQVKSKIQQAIAQTFQINVDSLYLTHPTFFSKLTNAEPKTEHDEYWHAHVDKETYPAFHYTALVYVSDHGVDFTGGRLIFIDNKVNVTLEPRKGRVAMFSSGAENLHFVERVEKGKRFAITVSFTCDVSHSISDPVLH